MSENRLFENELPIGRKYRTLVRSVLYTYAIIMQYLNSFYSFTHRTEKADARQ